MPETYYIKLTQINKIITMRRRLLDFLRIFCYNIYKVRKRGETVMKTMIFVKWIVGDGIVTLAYNSREEVEHFRNNSPFVEFTGESADEIETVVSDELYEDLNSAFLLGVVTKRVRSEYNLDFIGEDELY